MVTSTQENRHGGSKRADSQEAHTLGSVGQVTAPPLLIQLLATVSGKAKGDGPSTWTLLPMWEARVEFLAPGWLQLSPDLEVTANGRIKPEDGRSVSLSLCLLNK